MLERTSVFSFGVVSNNLLLRSSIDYIYGVLVVHAVVPYISIAFVGFIVHMCVCDSVLMSVYICLHSLQHEQFPLQENQQKGGGALC